MTPSNFFPCFIYLRIYNKENIIKIYTGITGSMSRRQFEHNSNLSKTTKIYNKNFDLVEIRYKLIGSYLTSRAYEKTFKKYNQFKKLKISQNWKRWTG